jgi:DNA repair protein RadC
LKPKYCIASDILAAIPRVQETGTAVIDKPETLYPVLSEIANLAQEIFCVVLLNTKNKVIGIKPVTVGILDCSVVHPREVFYCAIKASAKAIIVAHNHPSGDLTPSPEDIHSGVKLVKSGKILDIPVLDSVIVGPATTKVYSLRQHGHLEAD